MFDDNHTIITAFIICWLHVSLKWVSILFYVIRHRELVPWRLEPVPPFAFNFCNFQCSIQIHWRDKKHLESPSVSCSKECKLHQWLCQNASLINMSPGHYFKVHRGNFKLAWAAIYTINSLAYASSALSHIALGAERQKSQKLHRTVQTPRLQWCFCYTGKRAKHPIICCCSGQKKSNDRIFINTWQLQEILELWE